MALETQLSKTKTRPDGGLTETTIYQDRLHDQTERLSYDRSFLSVMHKLSYCQLCATITKIEMVSEQLNEQKMLKEEAEPKTTDVRYELDDAKAKIAQFEGHESPVQAYVDRVLKLAG